MTNYNTSELQKDRRVVLCALVLCTQCCQQLQYIPTGVNGGCVGLSGLQEVGEASIPHCAQWLCTQSMHCSHFLD